VKYLASLAQTSDYEVISLPKYTMANLSGHQPGDGRPRARRDRSSRSPRCRRPASTPGRFTRSPWAGQAPGVTAILSGQVDLAPVLAPRRGHRGRDRQGQDPAQRRPGARRLPAAGADRQRRVSPPTRRRRRPRSPPSSTPSDGRRANSSDYIKTATANQLTAGLSAAESLAAWTQLKKRKLLSPPTAPSAPRRSTRPSATPTSRRAA